MTPRVGSLFSGIGGLDLGFEAAGFDVVFQVEIDPFCRSILSKHWPSIPRHDDVRTFPSTSADNWACDVLCGGVPCQDVSQANVGRKGLAGERSGLWGEFARIVRLLRPSVVVVENTPGLLAPVLGDAGLPADAPVATVLRDLAEAGYDAEWGLLSCGQVGAPHRRDRIFLLAYPVGLGRREGVSEPQQDQKSAGQPASEGRCGWAAEPALVRVAYGVPSGVDRVTSLGNAVSPPVAEELAWRVRLIFEAWFAGGEGPRPTWRARSK